MTTVRSAALPVVMLRSLLRFTAVQGLLILTIALLLQQFVYTGTEASRAVRASAWLAFGVQVITFAIARVVSRDNVIAGWVLGIVLRFASVAFWAFLGIKAVGVPSSPALLSLVLFYFVSTLVEPLFLNA